MNAETLEQMNVEAEKLRKAFNLVCNRKDWKAPIKATIPACRRELTAKAIEFMTATTAIFKDADPGFLIVESVGYYNGPAN